MKDRIAFAGTVTAEGRRIRGSVKLAGSRTQRYNEWVEIDPAAFAEADTSDIVARFNHDESKILGRTKNGTLRVKFTDDGIEYETDDLPNTTSANDTLELLRGGYVTGSSFEIEGIESEVFTEDGETVRRYTRIERVNDVSPVPHPAFESSLAAAFSKENHPVSDETTTAPPAVEEPAREAPPVKFTAPSTSEQFEAAARGLTNDQLVNAMDGIMADTGGKLEGEMLARYEAFAKVHADRTAVSNEEREKADRFKALHDLRLGRIKQPASEAGLYASDDYRAAFKNMLRTGDARGMEQFAQSISGSGAEGGYTVPTEFRTKIVETQLAFGGIQQHADIVETGDGRSLPWPTNNDTANSAVVATEGSAPGSAGADLVFGQINLGSFSIAATGTSNAPLKVSWELLQDSAFDIEGFVAKKLGQRLGRKAAAYYATGTGTTEPFGLFAKTPQTMTATTAYAAFVEHLFQVDAAYRNAGNCRWIMSDTTLAKVYNSLDDNGRPLFTASASAGGQSGPAGTILGYPVTIDPGAAALVAFGDIQQGFVIRRVRDIQVVVDPYNNTATRQNAYHAWMRTDSAIQDSAAVSVSDYASVTADTASG